MRRIFSGSPTSIKLRGKAVPGALIRHDGIRGFDQQRYCRARVVCVGAGGLMSNIAPTLCRKGIGKLTIFDDDTVEASNLNRQRFYAKDIGKNKAIALARNLQRECTFGTELIGHVLRLQEAIESGLLPPCDVAICGVDNNPARVIASRFFRTKGIPAIFSAVSRDADHGYVFVQEPGNACLSCLLPDIVNDQRYPCPNTPAMADILQAVGALAVYAADSIVTGRSRSWNYRVTRLAHGQDNASGRIYRRTTCALCGDTSEVKE